MEMDVRTKSSVSRTNLSCHEITLVIFAVLCASRWLQEEDLCFRKDFDLFVLYKQYSTCVAVAESQILFVGYFLRDLFQMSLGTSFMCSFQSYRKLLFRFVHDPPIFLFELLSSLVDSFFISKARFKLPAKANAKWILVMQQSVRTPFETQSNLLRSKHSQKVWTGLNSLPTRYITTSFARPQSLQV